jgi:RNA polymerase sigma-70 factor (ECF subfamily)
VRGATAALGDEVTARLQELHDRARFEELYGGTRVSVLGYLARRSRSPEDAADLLAEVYLTAWRRIDDVPAGDEARLWLFGVARRVLANHQRRVRTESGLASALEASLCSVPLTFDADADPRSDAVAEALARLSAKDRELLTLSAWEDLSPAEIAVVLGQRVGVVRVRLHRARKNLREKLSASPAFSLHASSGSRESVGLTASGRTTAVAPR